MRIEIDAFHPAATKVCLTHSEVHKLVMGMRNDDVNVVLGYEDMDYERPCAEYGSKGERRRVEL